MSLLCGLPTLLYNTLRRPPRQLTNDVQLCVLVFAGSRPAAWKTAFKMTEFVLFFLVPVVVQVYLYAIIGRKLFVGSKLLYLRQQVCHIILVKSRIAKKLNGVC